MNKKPLKHRVSHLLRRASSSAVSERKHINGNLHRESEVGFSSVNCYQLVTALPRITQWLLDCDTQQDGNMEKRGATEKESFRRWSEVKHQLVTLEVVASRHMFRVYQIDKWLVWVPLLIPSSSGGSLGWQQCWGAGRGRGGRGRGGSRSQERTGSCHWWMCLLVDDDVMRLNKLWLLRLHWILNNKSTLCSTWPSNFTQSKILILP